MERVLECCYDDMRRLARRMVAGDSLRIVFQPTDLANEAVLRLLQSAPVAVQDRGHLLALAARTIRRVLIDEARRQARIKRRRPELLTRLPGAPPTALISVEDFDAALAALERFSPEHARVVELRFTFGLTVEEAAATLGVAERTVKRRWQAARAWLQDHIGNAHEPG
jgi:RNA polymerase sigma factor (TIGR02999 family)